MSDKIFGHSWEDIQSMQQGKYTPRTISNSTDGKKPATESDHEMLKKHGVDGLRELGFFGVLDRLNLLQKDVK